MTVSTSLKIPEPLKLRIAQLALDMGKTPHAFMVEALEAETQRSEFRRDFVVTALEAEQEVAKYGEVYAMDAVHKYLSDKLQQKPARKPKASSMRTVATTTTLKKPKS